MLKKCLSICLLALIFASCNEPAPKSESSFKSIQGEAQGTTYLVSYNAAEGGVEKAELDSIFLAIDMALSVWKPQSVISKFNELDTLVVDNPHFLSVYFRGLEIAELSQGDFELRISPLVRAWGFGPEGGRIKEGVNFDSLLSVVQTPIEFEYMKDDSGNVLDDELQFAKLKGQSIDVNGIAQGYTVDVLGEFMSSRGIGNYMIEVGGEIITKGKNASGKPWSIGIDKPVPLDQERELEVVLEISGKALATSGSYRKFYTVDGRRYSHTIDPKTAQPVDHNLLSATVIAPNCTNADAFATVFMVKGVDGTKKFLAEHPELDLSVYLIYTNESGDFETYMSPELKKNLKS